MKYIIFNLTGNKLGSYSGELDESSNSRSYLLCPPHAMHLPLPDGMDEDCIKLVFVPERIIPEQLVPAQIIQAEQIIPASGNPGDPDYVAERIIPAVMTEEYTIPAQIIAEHFEIQLDEQLVQAKALMIKEKQISDLKDQLNIVVLNQMAVVFGTNNPDSASANLETWKRMKELPSIFVGKLGFTTEEEILAYANQKLAIADEYAIFRMEKILEFQQAVAQLDLV